MGNPGLLQELPDITPLLAQDCGDGEQAAATLANSPIAAATNAMALQFVTTTFTIEGYAIREYKGLVRGIVALADAGSGVVGQPADTRRPSRHL
jgi:hypothetical protein